MSRRNVVGLFTPYLLVIFHNGCQVRTVDTVWQVRSPIKSDQISDSIEHWTSRLFSQYLNFSSKYKRRTEAFRIYSAVPPPKYPCDLSALTPHNYKRSAATEHSKSAYGSNNVYLTTFKHLLESYI